jgi:hypothetical protein
MRLQWTEDVSSPAGGRAGGYGRAGGGAPARKSPPPVFS